MVLQQLLGGGAGGESQRQDVMLRLSFEVIDFDQHEVAGDGAVGRQGNVLQHAHLLNIAGLAAEPAHRLQEGGQHRLQRGLRLSLENFLPLTDHVHLGRLVSRTRQSGFNRLAFEQEPVEREGPQA